MTELHHLVHSDGLATERAALAKVAPHLAPMRSRILAAHEEAGERGLTPDEWAEDNGALINTVRRRFTDLWKDGKIHPTTRSRENASGNACVVWVLGEDPDGRAPRNESLRNQLRVALEQIAFLEAELRRRPAQLDLLG